MCRSGRTGETADAQFVTRAVQERALLEERYDNQPARGSILRSSPKMLIKRFTSEEGKAKDALLALEATRHGVLPAATAR
jgi:hypothetical protein